MPTTEPRLGLDKPLTSDDFDTAEIAANLQKIANSPGAFICTSGTRPGSWTGSNEGQFIFETDTGLLWRWNGSAFVRYGAKGYLDSNRRTSDLLCTGSFATIAQVTVTVPAGGRSIRLTGQWADLSGGTAQFALFRGSTQLAAQKSAAGTGGSIVFTDVAPSSGSTVYVLKVKNASGTATILCSSTAPCSIDAEEV